MTRADLSRRIFVLLLSLLGTAALFLPFTWGVSPWEAVTRDKFLGQIFLLGAPFFLSIPVVAWQVRRPVANRSTTGEIAAAYLLSTAAMLSALVVETWILSDRNWTPRGADVVLIAALIAAIVANALLLVRNLRAMVSREATAEAFLLGGYVPNAMFCLLLFGVFESHRLQVGAYLTAAVSIGYVAAIVLLSREKPDGTPGPVEASRTKIAGEAR